MLITGFHKNNFIQFGHRLTEDDLYNDNKLDKFDEKNKNTTELNCANLWTQIMRNNE